MNKELKIYGIFLMLIGLTFLLEFKNPTKNAENHQDLTNLPAIEKVIVNVPCNLYIQQGEEQKLMIENTGGLFKDIKTSIDGESLTIDGTLLGNAYAAWESLVSQSPKINIYISLKNIEDLELCNFCKEKTSGSINKQQLSLSVQQAGIMILIDKKA